MLLDEPESLERIPAQWETLPPKQTKAKRDETDPCVTVIGHLLM